MLKVLLFTFHRQLVLSSMRQRLKKLQKKEQGRVFRPQKLIHYSYVLGSFLKIFFFNPRVALDFLAIVNRAYITVKRNCQLVRVEQTVRCDNDVTGHPHETEVHRMCVCQKSSQSKGEGKAHCLVVVVVVVVVFTRPTYQALGMLPTDVIQTDTGAGQPRTQKT